MSRRGQGAMSDEGMMKKKGAGGGDIFLMMKNMEACITHKRQLCILNDLATLGDLTYLLFIFFEAQRLTT